MPASILIHVTRQDVDAVSFDCYQIPIRCRNCDAELYAVIEKGALADLVKNEECAVCECVGELRKVVRP